MKTAVVTGGIATGKSEFCRLLLELVPGAVFFDCDREVHDLLTTNAIKDRLEAEFGDRILSPEAEVDRSRLGSIVFHDAAARGLLERILHPSVLERCLASRDRAAAESEAPLFLADVPLYYQVEFPIDADEVFVVALSEETQRQRLRSRLEEAGAEAGTGLSDDRIDDLLAAQIPVSEKIERSDRVIWNEGNLEQLAAQARIAARAMNLKTDHMENEPAPAPAARDAETKTKTETDAGGEAGAGAEAKGNPPPAGTDDGAAQAEAAVEESPPPPPVPDEIDLNKFQEETVGYLHELGVALGLRVGGSRSKHELVFEILSYYGRRGCRIEAEGLLEVTKEGNGFLRWPRYSFAPNPDDVYVAPALIKKSQVRSGNLVRAVLRAPKDKEKYLCAQSLISVEGRPAEEWENPPGFDKLTALFPTERIILEHAETESVSPRVVDLVAPLGKGQRGLIVAPPRGGKTILLKDIATAITKNHPEVDLIILLLDERPEEVTDFEETVNAPVYSSTFDESPHRHVQVAELVSERARRLVEMGRDVVILLDSITRLARGYNALQSGKGRIMSGGVESKALLKPKKFFSAARNVEDGGSLTILATALIETESRMDEVIFEEFKGTGNMEIHLDRELAEQRVFPSIHTLKSGTRKDELLYHPDEHRRVNMIRKQLAQMPAVEAMQVLIRHIQVTSSNAELLLKGLNV